MSREKPNIDTAEYRGSAVKLANESDQTVAQLAKELRFNVNTPHTWIAKSICYGKPPSVIDAIWLSPKPEP